MSAIFFTDQEGAPLIATDLQSQKLLLPSAKGKNIEKYEIPAGGLHGGSERNSPQIVQRESPPLGGYFSHGRWDQMSNLLLKKCPRSGNCFDRQ